MPQVLYNQHMFEVYRANTFTEFMDLLRQSRQRGTRVYSYKHLANKLGYRSPRSLAMVHKGQRPPSRGLVRKIVEQFEFSPQQAEFISLLAEKAIRRTDTAAIDRKIEMLRSSDDWRLLVKESDLNVIQDRMKLFWTEIKNEFELAPSEEKAFELNFKISKRP